MKKIMQQKKAQKTREWIPLLACIALAQSAGALGSLFTANAVTRWYPLINKPDITPPSWIFGPVWITLYTLMGCAAFIVWKKAKATRAGKIALGIFGLQLILNALWSLLFFGVKNIPLALGEIILLWLAIVATILAFARISRTAAWLLIPYLLWVSFATYLNYAFWTLN